MGHDLNKLVQLQTAMGHDLNKLVQLQSAMGHDLYNLYSYRVRWGMTYLTCTATECDGT